MQTVRVALVGFGYWGPNLARNFVASPRTELVAVCDASPDRRALAHERYPDVEILDDLERVFARGDIDVVAIATPVRTHFDLVRRALIAGKDVFVEKPLCRTLDEALALRALVQETGRRVIVDHTFAFHPAVDALRDSVAAGRIGRTLYLDSVRTHFGLFRYDVGVLWDFAPHDLTILDLVLGGEQPSAVSCTGAKHLTGVESIVQLTLTYASGVVATCRLSWLAPEKTRCITIGGTEGVLVYDDLAERRVVLHEVRPVAGAGPLDPFPYRCEAPSPLDDVGGEPLRRAIDHLAGVVLDGEETRCGIGAGVAMMRILDAAQRSMELGGDVQRLTATQPEEVAS